MSSETAKLIRICESLPAARRQEVADFARFLIAQEQDARWESTLSDPTARPRLDAFLRESAAEDASPSIPIF